MKGIRRWSARRLSSYETDSRLLALTATCLLALTFLEFDDGNEPPSGTGYHHGRSGRDRAGGDREGLGESYCATVVPSHRDRLSGGHAIVADA